MKRIIKIIIGFMLVIFTTISSMTIVNAETTGSVLVSISSSNIKIGDTVTITGTPRSVNGDTTQATLAFTFDTGVFSFVSCSESLYGGGAGGTVTTTTTSASITLKAIASSSSSRVTISGNDGIVFNTNEEIVLSPGGASISVSNITVETGSSDNSLSSLKISNGSLSPSFKSSTVNYSATVNKDVSKVAVTAIPSNPKAVIKSVTGNENLVIGKNTIKILVQAENGATATYTITVTRDSEVEITSEVTTTEVSTEPLESIEINILGKTMTVATKLDGITLPAGYTAETYTYKEAEVPVAKNSDLGLMLFYLLDEEGTGSFYVYDEQADIFILYQTIQTAEGIFTLMQADDTVTVPLIYSRTRLTIDGQEMDGWLNDFEQDFGLVYVMNPSGEKGIYQYDFKENTIQRFNRELVDGLASAESSGNGTDETEGGIIGKFQDILGSFLGVIAFVALVLICIILIIVCIVLAVKNSRKREYEEDEDLTDIIGESEEYLEDETELNDDKVIPAPLIIDSNEPAEEMEQHVLLPDEETEVADEAMTDVDNTKIAEGVMTEEELLAFKKQCEDILSTGDSFEAKETDGFDDSNRSDLDLLADEGFEILDDDDDEVNE